MQKIQKVLTKMKISKDLPMSSIADDVCPHCSDFGWRKMTLDDLETGDFKPTDYDTKSGITTPEQKKEDLRKWITRGYEVSIPCQYCSDKRLKKHIDYWQTRSRMTDEERTKRIEQIKLIESNKGTAEVVKACKEMIDGKSFMITVQGTSGNAKSDALLSVVNAYLDKGKTALYITFSDALDWIRDAYNSDLTHKEDETALERFATLEGVTMLALDEMQDVKETEWTFSILAALINRRQRDAIDGTTFTILATNKDVNSLPKQILSRLKDGRNRENSGGVDTRKPIIINNDADLRPLMQRQEKLL